MEIFTCDDFNADCPENWEEILSFLNNLCEDYHFNEDEYPQLWDNFWYELGYDAANFDIIDHEQLERRLVQ